MKTRMWIATRAHVALVVILALCLCGCGPKPVMSIDETNLEGLLRNRVGVIVLVPEKRFEFFESCLFRVLYYEGRANYYSFEGIWDPALVLRENLVKTAQTELNLNVVPLWEELEPATYGRLVEACERSLNAVRKPANPRPVSQANTFGNSAFDAEWAENAPYEYLKATPLEGVRALRETLGVDIILEVSLAGISMVRGCGGSYLEVYAYGRLIRLSDGAVMWLDKGCGVRQKCKYKDFEALEKDDMKLIRQYYEEAVTHLLKPRGFTWKGGPFLRGLVRAGGE